MTALTLSEIRDRQDKVVASPFAKIEFTNERCICGSRLVRLGFSYGCTECQRVYRKEGKALVEVEK